MLQKPTSFAHEILLTRAFGPTAMVLRVWGSIPVRFQEVAEPSPSFPPKTALSLGKHFENPSEMSTSQTQFTSCSTGIWHHWATPFAILVTISGFGKPGTFHRRRGACSLLFTACCRRREYSATVSSGRCFGSAAEVASWISWEGPGMEVEFKFQGN